MFLKVSSSMWQVFVLLIALQVQYLKLLTQASGQTDAGLNSPRR